MPYDPVALDVELLTCSFIAIANHSHLWLKPPTEREGRMKIVAYLGLGIAVVGQAGPVLAQTAAEDASAVPQRPESAPADEPADTIVVTGDRAVTATKTDTPIVETPQAISVVPAELFLDRGARNVQETLRYSSGVTGEAYGLDTRSDNIFVRGLNPTEYQDGLRRTFNFSPIPRADVYTLDRIEVLRGPSSVLYGQGANGGIVNMVSKTPLFDMRGEAAIQYGSFDRKQAYVDVTGPLDSSRTIAGRVIGLVRDADQQTDVIRDDRLLLSPSISWRPSERTTITAIGLYQRDRNASSQQFLPVVATLDAPEGREIDVDTFLGDPDYDKLVARQFVGTLLLDHEFSDSIALHSRVRYVDAKTTFQEIFPDVYSNPLDPFIDADDRVVNRFAYQTRPRIKTLTTDNGLVFTFDTGPFAHQLLVGIDYSDFRQRSQSGFDSVTPIDIYDPVSSGVVAPAWVDDPNQRNSQLGLYVQDQIRYADRVSLVIGARRDRARSKTEGLDEQVDKATSFRAGIIGELFKDVSPYASYSEAFLPVAGLDFGGTAFVPIRGRQYEAGVKWQPRRGILVTASVYDIIETNRPINDPDNVLNTIQTGKVRSRGLELEGAATLPGEVQVTAAYSHIDAEVKVSAFQAEVGRQISDVPKDLASVWATKALPLGDALKLRIGGGLRYVGPTVSIGVAGELKTPSYTLADALAELEWKDWTLSLSATNLTNKTYYAPCRAFGDCFTGNKRSILATLSRRFGR